MPSRRRIEGPQEWGIALRLLLSEVQGYAFDKCDKQKGRTNMRRLVVFNMTTLDGFIADLNGDMSWARKQDAEWNAFAQANASGGGELLFGRITYDLMTSYWPTPQAMKNNPIVAERMNNLPKVVFSRTLEKASWNNTKLVKGDIAAEVRKMKKEPGPDMVILGSGTIISQLAPEGLIDEYQIVVNPVVLGRGKTMFDGIKKRLTLKLTKTRIFGNGNALLCYEPMA
jgi:dihydrofolate reductase